MEARSHAPYFAREQGQQVTGSSTAQIRTPGCPVTPGGTASLSPSRRQVDRSPLGRFYHPRVCMLQRFGHASDQLGNAGRYRAGSAQVKIEGDGNMPRPSLPSRAHEEALDLALGQE